MMVVDGATGKVVGDIPNTPGVHGAGFSTKAGHGFTTNSGDQTVTMFDLKTLAVLKQIKVGPGLDGIMHDEPDDKIILTNHSRPIGTLTAIDPNTGDIVATVELEDTAPEGAAADGKGHIFVNNESKNTIQVIDVKTWKATASWPIAPCDGPTGIAYDKASNRIFSGCSKTSVVVDAGTGKVVASIANGTRVDALGWDAAKKLMFIPNGGEGNVTVVHQDSPDKYTVVATVADVRGREDDHRRSDDAQRLSLSTRAWSCAAASGRCGAAGGRRPRPRSAGSGRRRLVHRHQVVTTSRSHAPRFQNLGVRLPAGPQVRLKADATSVLKPLHSCKVRASMGRVVEGVAVLLMLSVFFAYLTAPAVATLRQRLRIGRRQRPISNNAALALLYGTLVLSIVVDLAALGRWHHPLGTCHRAGGRRSAVHHGADGAPRSGHCQRTGESRDADGDQEPAGRRNRLSRARDSQHAAGNDRRGAACACGWRRRRLVSFMLLRSAPSFQRSALRAPAARPSAVARRRAPARRQQRAGGLRACANGGWSAGRLTLRDGLRAAWPAVRGVDGRRGRRPRTRAGDRSADGHGGRGDAGGRPGLARTPLLLVLRLVQDYVVYPRLVRRGMRLSTPAVILTIWIGAALAGAAGVIMAIPAAGFLSVSVRHWREYRDIERLIRAHATHRAPLNV